MQFCALSLWRPRQMSLVHDRLNDEWKREGGGGFDLGWTKTKATSADLSQAAQQLNIKTESSSWPMLFLLLINSSRSWSIQREASFQAIEDESGIWSCTCLRCAALRQKRGFEFCTPERNCSSKHIFNFDSWCLMLIFSSVRFLTCGWVGKSDIRLELQQLDAKWRDDVHRVCKSLQWWGGVINYHW